MANVLIDESSMTNIANAIRAKTGSTEGLKPADMASVIAGIQAGGGEDTLTEFLKVRDGQYLFSNCSTITEIPEIDFSFFTNISYAFDTCRSLKTLPEINSTNVTNMNFAFKDCYSLSSIAGLNTSNVNWLGGTFQNCESLTTIPEIDTSNVTTMSSLFNYCSSIQTIPELNTSKVTRMNEMFSNCVKLETIPILDAKQVTYIRYMFNTCKMLHTIPYLDIRSVTSGGGEFDKCHNLTNLTLKNIKISLTVGSGTSWGHLLTLDSLTGLIYELRDTGSSKTLTVGSANLEKLANVYVKTIDITDEMRTEDDLIDEKLPFVVCESTDEGAMLITEYVVLKNWQLK